MSNSAGPIKFVLRNKTGPMILSSKVRTQSLDSKLGPRPLEDLAGLFLNLELVISVIATRWLIVFRFRIVQGTKKEQHRIIFKILFIFRHWLRWHFEH